jgi:2'-5' RNA ligase
MAGDKKYSLWLMPSGSVYPKLRALIEELSKRYSSPMFEPHVTLAGPFTGQEGDVIARAEKLSRIIKPCAINLGEVDMMDDFHRCLFIMVAKTRELMTANLEACKLFKLRSNYMPHLSLIHGNFPVDVKKEIIETLGRFEGMSFTAHSMHLFVIDGDVKNWHRIKEFRLQ